MGGEVVHFEIPADNTKRARTFYEKTFGWKMTPMPEMDYTMVSTGEVDGEGMPKAPGYIGGGIAKRGPPNQVPVVVIMVADIDAAAKSVQQNGGKMVRAKMPVGEMGFAAYFHDSEGNVVGLFQPTQM